MGTTRFGSWCDIPAISPLPIYRRGYERERVVIDPKTKERVVIPSKTTYAQIDAWELPTGLDPVRKLYYFDARGAVAQRVFTDTLGSHGARQARVFNLLAHSGGVRFGATRKVLPPGTEALIDIGAEPDTIFGFQFGIENGAESYISPEKNLRLRGDRQRLTVVLAYRPVVEGTKQNEYSSEETQAGKITYVPEALRIYENVDRPPSAANTGNRVVSR